MTSPPSTRRRDVPEILYGTAFKFDKSALLVEAALKAGFRAIDTAGSKSAYREALVGEGIKAALAMGKFKRSDLFIQTKFSPFKAGKDPAIYPYDHTKNISEQVAQSVESSLANLGVDYLDSLVLHSLYADIQDTFTAWKAMEALVPLKVNSLGLSNTDLQSLRRVNEMAIVKPSAVQNRFTQDTLERPNPEFPPDLPYPVVTWDRDVREYCRQQSIAYAPWGMLWGSLDNLEGPEQLMSKAGQEVGVSKEIACYALMRSLGGCKISLLCGTSNDGRMRETLEGLEKVKEYIAESDEQREKWEGFVVSLRLIADGAEGLKQDF